MTATEADAKIRGRLYITVYFDDDRLTVDSRFLRIGPFAVLVWSKIIIVHAGIASRVSLHMSHLIGFLVSDRIVQAKWLTQQMGSRCSVRLQFIRRPLRHTKLSSLHVSQTSILGRLCTTSHLPQLFSPSNLSWEDRDLQRALCPDPARLSTVSLKAPSWGWRYSHSILKSSDLWSPLIASPITATQTAPSPPKTHKFQSLHVSRSWLLCHLPGALAGLSFLALVQLLGRPPGVQCNAAFTRSSV